MRRLTCWTTLFPIKHLHCLHTGLVPGEVDWVLMQGAGGILDVHSRCTLSAFKKREFPIQYRDFQDKETYAEWMFVASVN